MFDSSSSKVRTPSFSLSFSNTNEAVRLFSGLLKDPVEKMEKAGQKWPQIVGFHLGKRRLSKKFNQSNATNCKISFGKEMVYEKVQLI